MEVEALTTVLMAQEGELQWIREDLDVAQREKEALQRKWDTSVQVAMERALEVQSLQECLMQREVRPVEVAEGWQVALEGGALWAELEAVGWREDWLAREAVSGHVGVLHKYLPSSPFCC
ncbi:hypothetical protein C0989_009902 [Termitomyces sp. Mn162]|nr:hypothetical protein C0989_009902 [Termitomyces sp. Mn162]